MSGTDLAYLAVCLRASYGKSGTELAYCDATQLWNKEVKGKHAAAVTQERSADPEISQLHREINQLHREINQLHREIKDQEQSNCPEVVASCA
eukprot:3588154-Rhodomonas_salina.2